MALRLAVCSALFLSAAASAQPLASVSPEKAGFSASGLERIDKFFEREISADRVPGAVVAIAASIAGDTSQDLKTGFLLGATPRYQQIGQLLGVLTSAAFVCMAVLLLGRAYGFGTEEIPAPQATLMKLVIEGVLDQTLPWTLVAIGAGITVIAALFRLPTLAFAVGVYLPVAAMVPIFLGGLLRLWTDRGKDAAARGDQGVLLGSGLVGGEGLV